MSSVACARCRKVLEFSGDRPSFCAYCGSALSSDVGDVTVDHRSSEELGLGRQGEAFDGLMPTAIAGYRIVRKIGDGGMGTVYEAEDSTHGRRVAVKVLKDRYEIGADSIERFRQEGRLASTIAHPRCVFVLAADESEGRPYIVMELMTGSTLQSLVEHSGPLPIEEAVGRILDVIDGLREAHRLGVIHRDVKPSNCFLEADGRVKVGDFGLSKSLGSSPQLTRTGAFVGTPLYASPEQIKGESVEERTDVYSVSATLYYLLTGRPPFQAQDAAAALARIVSESPMSPREYAPAVPLALESAILRGMDRDRERRFRGLEELREALQPFASDPMPAATIGSRVGAMAIDLVLLVAASIAVYGAALGVKARWGEVPSEVVHWGGDLIFWLAYFGTGEGLLAMTVGKRILGLRVLADEAKRPPGVGRALLRCAIVYACLWAPAGVVLMVLPKSTSRIAASEGAGDAGDVAFDNSILMAVGAAALVGLGCLGLMSTMSEANGFRGPHERASRTHTTRLPRRARRREAPGRRQMGREREVIRRPMGVMEQVGPYKIRGAVRWEGDRRVLSAQDRVLGREVWVVMRGRGAEPVPATRRDMARPTRPRWLAGGTQAEGRWDAFVAPSGEVIADLAGPDGMSWEDARPLLTALAAELAAACADGTLPPGLMPDQVWVEPDGRLQLVDPLGTTTGATSTDPGLSTDDQRALRLFTAVAALALEGGRRRTGDVTTTIRAAVPLGVRRLLDRLTGHGSPFESAAELNEALATQAHRPTQLGPVARFVRLAGYVFSVPIRLVLAATVVAALARLGAFAWVPTILYRHLPSVFLLGYVVAAAITRCQMVPRLYDAAMVDDVGRVPTRWRCAWRELLVWIPVILLLNATMALATSLGSAALVGRLELLRLLFFAWPVVDALYELFDPGRTLHDRLSGTRIVPR